jgi:phosphoribosyl 1,2-cyclic phosphodiesterase
VRCARSRPKLDPSRLDAIILTHRHLDHSGDINVMIEAMTEGGFNKRGVVFCPADALEGDPVIFKYVRAFPERIQVMRGRRTYAVGSFEFQTSMRHVHPAETYGLKFRIGNTQVGLLSDTAYFGKLPDFYGKVDILIIGVVFNKPRPEIAHLSLPEAEALIRKIKPGRAILTHFGMSMLKARPKLLAEELSKRLKIEVVAAEDGMVVKDEN